ncbi:MAG: paaX [Klenkia sp.]|nr:paaX [Klenkia sp.]
MKPRSLVFDVFGDHLRYRGGEAQLRHLVALMAPFGIPETTARVALARLRKEGWLSSRRDGRGTVYSLTDQSWALLDEGRDRIFDRARGPWSGTWSMVIYTVPEAERALREQLRRRLAWFGFGPLSTSVWISPHDRVDEVVASLDDSPGARIDTFRSASAGLTADRDIATRAWDLVGLERDYRELLATYDARLPAYRAGAVTGAQALVERLQLVRDYRTFPFRDPDLPPELLPEQWPGRRAHDVFLEAHSLLRAPAEAYIDEVTGAS